MTIDAIIVNGRALKPVRRTGLEGQRIYDALLEEIVSGTLRPGTKISEPDVARRFGISRGPLREAIRRLEERQLVQCTPNAGARVVAHTPEDIIDAYQLREALESMAARLAATNMTDVEVAELRDIFEEEKSRGRSAGFPRDFHMHIVIGSRNRRIARIINEDFYRLLRLWRRNCDWLSYGTEQSWRDHGRILDAIEHRDPEAAELLMRRHLSWLRTESLRQLCELKRAKPAA
ncbi:MAG TPA: GntR family transcriptional regulator [Enterovirga sp.]